jgi:hypothetical protein
MNDRSAPALDGAELTRLLQAVEPAVLLVPPRLLRRVIKHDREVTGFVLQVPHRRSYVIGGQELLKIVGRDELGLAAGSELPARAVLLAGPSADTLASTAREVTLLKYWRMLFHALVHLHLERSFAETDLSEAGIRKRLFRIGHTEFEEIRRVLRQDEYLLPPYDDRTTYIEFAALYLELRLFAANLLPHYFPTLEQRQHIDGLLAEDVDAATVFASSRPAGAPDPVILEEQSGDDVEAALPLPEEGVLGDAESPADVQQLLERADKARRVGNQVRAAILRTRAARIAPAGQKQEIGYGANSEMNRLATRLRAALGFSPEETDSWARLLTALLAPAARGVWPVEARLLYDLQKVCIDHERELYALDLVEWAVSLGRRPVKRPVPCQSAVLRLKHLRTAARRLRNARLAEADRRKLASFFASAIHANAEKLRERFRPLLHDSLFEVGLRPADLPERVALNKLVEELLDRICDFGYLTMSDLRDSISRNNLKFPDLGGLKEWAVGDRLLRSNRRLPVILDGVYRRGELYLRWLQRGSSIAFGTAPGRLFTRYVALPFGGAFVVIEGVQHFVHLAAKLMGHHLKSLTPTALGISVAVLGLFLLGILHIERFRKGVLGALDMVFRSLYYVLIDCPRRLFSLPVIRTILESEAMGILYQTAFKPLIPTGVTGLILVAARAEVNAIVALCGAVFVLTGLLLNTRLGRNLEEALTDWLVRSWQRISFNLLPGLFRMIMGFFKWFVEAVDRSIYRVDEWLRFHTGDSRLALVVKPILGLVWFLLTFVVRFCVLVLIEPQINPIKHVPVVTVSHKLVLTFFLYPFKSFLHESMGYDELTAGTIAGVVSFVIPGLFGFLVWELKENWRLYRANMAPTLRPVPIGSHGETMLRFLRPGLHSGTIPKLFGKLRRAERSAQRSGTWKTVHKHEETLHHVQEKISYFVDRELVFLLNQNLPWAMTSLTLGEIGLATNRVRVCVHCPALNAADLEFVFEEQAGWLVAGIRKPGWLQKLSSDQKSELAAALGGVYKIAGVDLVQEQLTACFGDGSVIYGVAQGGRLMRYRLDSEEALLELNTDQTLPHPCGAELLLKSAPVTWDEWVQVWNDEPHQGAVPKPILRGWHLLPVTADPDPSFPEPPTE